MPASSGAARSTGLGARAALVLAGALTVARWQVPWGPYALYPFTLLATYAHELGHGLTALAVGGRFESLELFPDGSGLARWSGDVGRLGRAAVAAGGLVGPSVAGALILALSREPRRAPLHLALLGSGMLATVLLFTRGDFAPAFALGGGLALLGVARLAPRGASLLLLRLLGVQLCLAVFRDLDYMFSDGGVVGGVARPSDSAAIAEALLLPHWFWGGAVALASFAVLALGLRAALRE
jgi:hypothetical protein